MSKCDKLVLKKKAGYGYKVYVSKLAAKRAGAKVCGGEIVVSDSVDSHWASSNGWNGEGRYVSHFNGFDVMCNKCGDVKNYYDSDDLERLVAKAEGL